jgi:hypothetical protein
MSRIARTMRAWISQGGPAKFLLNDGMNSSEFIEAVGAQYLNDAYGTSSGTVETASTRYFYDNYGEISGGIAPDAPAADRRAARHAYGCSRPTGRRCNIEKRRWRSASTSTTNDLLSA